MLCRVEASFGVTVAAEKAACSLFSAPLMPESCEMVKIWSSCPSCWARASAAALPFELKAHIRFNQLIARIQRARRSHAAREPHREVESLGCQQLRLAGIPGRGGVRDVRLHNAHAALEDLHCAGGVPQRNHQIAHAALLSCRPISRNCPAATASPPASAHRHSACTPRLGAPC